MKDNKLSAVIDFGRVCLGNPACDLVITWIFLDSKTRDIFMKKVIFEEGTWLCAKAWALWKATFGWCQITNRNASGFETHKKIIEDLLNE